MNNGETGCTSGKKAVAPVFSSWMKLEYIKIYEAGIVAVNRGFCVPTTE